MDNPKNLVFAIVSSILILFLWQYFYVTPRMEQVKKQQVLSINAANERQTTVSPIAPAKETLVSREAALSENGRIIIDAPRVHGSISLKGARFDDLTLAKYKITTTKNSPEVMLLSPSNTKNLYFAEFGWVATDKSIPMPNSNTIWSSDSKTLSTEKPVTLFWDNDKGLKFYITIAIDKNYMFEVASKVENYGTNSASLLPYGILSRTADTNHQSFAILHEGGLGVFNGELKELRWSDLKDDKKNTFDSNNGWLGFTDKYWLTAIMPSAGNSFNSNFTHFMRNGQDRFQADYMGQQYDIAPGEQTTFSSLLFAGAKEVNLLDQYSKSFNIPLFDRAVDFGRLYFITNPLFKLLTLFHKLVGNFGVAILLLTVAVKLVMFPLANKSYMSMNMLKKMQPQVKELQEHYKDDKLKANKAIMELYKEEKVNPMSGCLPMIIQIPVFFALYKVLFVTIEMRHAPFFGWISDLSAPDYTTIFNLFGLIPWDPPSMLHIGAWPVIMAITMYFQQKMNPAPTDPVQAKVMKFLPVMFLFMFASFPAGLVIYWAWNNTLSIAQQWLLIRKVKKD
jgi:YidC/Oxa1 family membrane protein insertase